MKNYQAVEQWAATVNVDKAVNEIEILKLKYPWLKCEETIATLKKMQEDIPNIIRIILLQEKQNAILRMSDHNLREYIRVNGLADTVIIDAITEKFKL